MSHFCSVKWKESNSGCGRQSFAAAGVLKCQGLEQQASPPNVVYGTFYPESIRSDIMPYKYKVMAEESGALKILFSEIDCWESE